MSELEWVAQTNTCVYTPTRTRMYLQGEWAQVGGCGSGRGQLQLACTFRSFKTLKPMESGTVQKGILIFKVCQIASLCRQCLHCVCRCLH